MFTTLKNKLIAGLSLAGAIILGIFYLLRPKKETVDEFPHEEKKKLEKELNSIEKSIDKLDKKVYSDKEIEDKFNEKI